MPGFHAAVLRVRVTGPSAAALTTHWHRSLGASEARLRPAAPIYSNLKLDLRVSAQCAGPRCKRVARAWPVPVLTDSGHRQGGDSDELCLPSKPASASSPGPSAQATHWHRRRPALSDGSEGQLERADSDDSEVPSGTAGAVTGTVTVGHLSESSASIMMFGPVPASAP